MIRFDTKIFEIDAIWRISFFHFSAFVPSEFIIFPCLIRSQAKTVLPADFKGMGLPWIVNARHLTNTQINDGKILCRYNQVNSLAVERGH